MNEVTLHGKESIVYLSFVDHNGNIHRVTIEVNPSAICRSGISIAINKKYIYEMECGECGEQNERFILEYRVPKGQK